MKLGWWEDAIHVDKTNLAIQMEGQGIRGSGKEIADPFSLNILKLWQKSQLVSMIWIAVNRWAAQAFWGWIGRHQNLLLGWGCMSTTRGMGDRIKPRLEGSMWATLVSAHWICPDEKWAQNPFSPKQLRYRTAVLRYRPGKTPGKHRKNGSRSNQRRPLVVLGEWKSDPGDYLHPKELHVSPDKAVEWQIQTKIRVVQLSSCLFWLWNHYVEMSRSQVDWWI